jgi:hypothetical protein
MDSRSGPFAEAMVNHSLILRSKRSKEVSIGSLLYKKLIGPIQADFLSQVHVSVVQNY